MSYLTDLTEKQKDLITAIIGDDMPIMRKYCVFDILNAIFYVERTFAWAEDFRRLTRNYEKHLLVAAGIFMAACVSFMLRYF